MTTIEVMKQAAEALDDYKYAEARIALRAEIERLEKCEPVAYLSQRTWDSFMVAGYETCEKGDYGSFPVYRHPYSIKKAEPIGFAEWWRTRPKYPHHFEEDMCESAYYAGFDEGVSTHPAPADEIESLRQRVAELEKERDKVKDERTN